ncbi:hypothetical protein B0F90DRAFT_1816567 [Multifurca ochricompacta]|uniref:Uncharacterized protein n=1 Tax=Multifurca ochricompacta TaxID=376703 RepID=A0AAD4M5Z2_9AGAM|nr:hypothetical protein B0F90DRAFT_1816567 [Multifurca ochricompacta]
MPDRLRLKRTPAEQAERDLRKARKASKRAAFGHRRAQDADLDSDTRTPKRSDIVDNIDSDFGFSNPGPSTSRYDFHATGLEEQFQEKLWDALGDDDRLDAVEARLNEYAHVPRRRRNAATYSEQLRQKAARAAAQAEAARILKAKEESLRRKREKRERRRYADARNAYERRWVEFLESKSADLRFSDVPWPVRGQADISRLTAEAISAFLFPQVEGRIIPRVREEERDVVREGANAVARAVTTLMEMKL